MSPPLSQAWAQAYQSPYEPPDLETPQAAQEALAKVGVSVETVPAKGSAELPFIFYSPAIALPAAVPGNWVNLWQFPATQNRPPKPLPTTHPKPLSLNPKMPSRIPNDPSRPSLCSESRSGSGSGSGSGSPPPVTRRASATKVREHVGLPFALAKYRLREASQMEIQPPLIPRCLVCAALLDHRRRGVRTCSNACRNALSRIVRRHRPPSAEGTQQ